VVLQSDISETGVIFVGDVELVAGDIWPDGRFFEVRQVDCVDFDAIQDNDLGSRTDYHEMLPLTNSLECVLDRFGD